MTSRKRRGRGRRSLLWALLAFGAIQVSTSAALDVGWPGPRFPLAQGVLDRLDQADPAAAVVAIGSSRTAGLVGAHAVTAAARELTGDPGLTVLNVAVPHGDPVVCERVLGRVLERGIRPRYVVIEFCPEGVNHYNGWMPLQAGRVLGWRDLPAYARELAATGCLLRYTGTRLLPVHVYRHELRTALADWAAGRRAAPASPAAPPPPSDLVRAPEDAFKARQERLDVLLRGTGPRADLTLGLNNVVECVKDYRPGGNSAAALERMLQLCRRHDVEPILLAVPVSSPHRGCYTHEVDRAFRAYAEHVSRRFGCRFVDWRDALPDHMFADHHHVNALGAEAFSEKFALHLVAPAWKGSSRPQPAVPAIGVSRPSSR